jgi:cold shock CspA family protein
MSEPVSSTGDNRQPTVGMMDAEGGFSSNDKTNLNVFIRAGAVQLYQNKPLEEVQVVVNSALDLIQKLK